MRSLFVAILAAALVPLTACNLYFSDDDPPQCDQWGGGSGGGGLAEPAILLRNPQTGACEAFGSRGPDPLPPPCDGNECGPCYGSGSDGTGSGSTGSTSTDPDTTPSGPSEDSAERAPYPDWGSCESYCTGLDETTCLGTEACRGIYATGIDSTEFLECWSTGGAPVFVQDCVGLDAYTCSQLDQCIAIHEYSCDDGSEQDPSGGLVPPTCTPGLFLSCGNEPVDVTGCYSNDECDPGSRCNAAEVCNPPPSDFDCPPAGCDVPTVCYGVCVPDLMPVDCSEVPSEAACIARQDCNAYYVGENCECDTDPDSCVCSTWTYDSCDTLPAP